MKPKISVLVSARKNSKYLSKFLLGYFQRTRDQINTEILVMLNEHDTWNDELVNFYGSTVKFYREDYELGRAGLHIYFNDLYEHAKGDWIVYFCEDHFIIMDEWDEYVRSMIDGSLMVDTKTEVGFALKHEYGILDSKQPYCLVPKFDNCGDMNQILSRGYCETIGGMGKHGWIDSYINDLNQVAFGIGRGRVFRFDKDMFHDFTHDHPNPMSDAHMQSISTKKAKTELPKYKSHEVEELIQIDAKQIIRKLEV